MPPKKAKATASLADMVDSDGDLDLAPPIGSDRENEPETQAKRGGRYNATRGRPAKSRTKPLTSKTAKNVATAKRAPLKEQQNSQAYSDEEDDELDSQGNQGNAVTHEDTQMNEMEAPVKKQPGRKGRPPGKAKQSVVQKGTLDKVKVIEKDGEFEYTPTKSIHSIKDKNNTRVEDIEDVDMEEAEMIDERDHRGSDEPRTAGSTRKVTGSRNAPRPGSVSTTAMRRKASESDTERSGDPTLRRKVGEMTRKLESLETKHRNLREIGILEAEANYDRLKKQSEQRAKAANDLIESLRAELEIHKAVAHEARTQTTDLSDTRKELAKHKATIADLEAAHSTLQNENRALNIKLSATRTASQEPTKVPLSAARGKAAAGRGPGQSIDENQQIAQLKEDLYSDLTGLIIRDVERQESQDVYDCIQTGRNGTLHFKLSIVTDKEAASTYEDAEFAYEPRIDANRDRELIDLMPEYLCEDITFSRNNAARFYSRISDTLTKKIVD